MPEYAYDDLYSMAMRWAFEKDTSKGKVYKMRDEPDEPGYWIKDPVLGWQKLDIPNPHDYEEARHSGASVSDGSHADYYILPTHAKELRHLISAKSMSFARGNVFKACYRLGEKEGVDILYDLNKMKLFVEDMLEMVERGEKV